MKLPLICQPQDYPSQQNADLLWNNCTKRKALFYLNPSFRQFQVIQCADRKLFFLPFSRSTGTIDRSTWWMTLANCRKDETFLSLSLSLSFFSMGFRGSSSLVVAQSVKDSRLHLQSWRNALWRVFHSTLWTSPISESSAFQRMIKQQFWVFFLNLTLLHRKWTKGFHHETEKVGSFLFGTGTLQQRKTNKNAARREINVLRTNLSIW